MLPHIFGNGRLGNQLVDQYYNCILLYISRRSVVFVLTWLTNVSAVIAIEIGLDVWNRRE